MDSAVHAPPPPDPHAADPDEALDQLLRLVITGFFVLTDGQGALSKWSDPAEFLFGLPAEEALGQPLFGRLVQPARLSPDAEAWRTFLEVGEVPGARGRCTVEADHPDGGTFPLETVFVPVRLDEGFDFSLFLEDLSFELPLDLMLLRMRQQHPVVVKALRAALADEPQAWEGWRTAGTLVAFRPLVETPWMDEALRRREEEAAAAEEELQARIQAYEAPGVQGDDVYDLEDARAVIDRLKWATERIADLEERSRAVEAAGEQARDAQLRAAAAEQAALDLRSEIAAALEDRDLHARVDEARAEAGEARRAAAEVAGHVERVDRGAASVLAEVRAQHEAVQQLREAVTSAEAGDAAAVQGLAARLDGLEGSTAEARERLDGRLHQLDEHVAGAFGRLDGLAGELGGLREETGAGRQDLEHRIWEAVGALRDELSGLREEAAAARADAAAAREAAARHDDAAVHEARERADAAAAATEALRGELQSALAAVAEHRQGFEEARQAAVAARRDAEAARAAAEGVGAASAASTEKFTEAWKAMLQAGNRAGAPGAAAAAWPRVSAPKAVQVTERAARPGFDDDPHPCAILDLRGRFRELNPAFTKLVGYREHEFAKASWPSVLDRPSYKAQLAQLEAVLAGELDVADVQSTYMHGQGLMVPVVGTVELVRDDAGEPSHLLLRAEAAGPHGH